MRNHDKWLKLILSRISNWFLKNITIGKNKPLLNKNKLMDGKVEVGVDYIGTLATDLSDGLKAGGNLN